MADKPTQASVAESSHLDLIDIKERLRKGQLKPDDIRQLDAIVLNAEEAIRRLRAAVVE